MEQSLYVGFDLCDDFSQISCYNEKTFEVDTIYLIPTVLAVKHDTKEWLYGEEALLCGQREEGIVLEHIIQKIQKKEKMVAFDVELSEVILLEKFFRKTISLLKKYYPNDSIKKLVITTKQLDKTLANMIYMALDNMGIHKDRVNIVSHEQSYIYYVLSQKKELWMNDVGLFDFREEGLFYHQITMNRKATPMVVNITTKDFSETLSYEMLNEQNEKESLEYIFDSISKTVLYKQIISTLYMTGKGFEGSWAEEALRELAVGRRVFKGMNLYTQGACYAARQSAGQGRIEKFIYLSKDVIGSTIALKVYHDAKIEEIVLAAAGTPWYEVDKKIDIIPDNEDEIQIIVKNVMKRESRSHLLNLDYLAKRPNKMTRLTVRVSFFNEKTCVVSLKDKGFGEYYPTNNRIWEKEIAL